MICQEMGVAHPPTGKTMSDLDHRVKQFVCRSTVVNVLDPQMTQGGVLVKENRQ
jgi:hypothetical protein